MKNTINRNTIVSYNTLVMSEEVPEFLKDSYEKAISFADSMMAGEHSKEDYEFWTAEMYLLENYGVVTLTTVEDYFDCFKEEETDAIIENINNTFDDEMFNSDAEQILRWYRDNSSWQTAEELKELDVDINDINVIIYDKAARAYFTVG